MCIGIANGDVLCYNTLSELKRVKDRGSSS
nr:MAG TPA: hypothetical protein [Caudoviricetes sp.]